MRLTRTFTRCALGLALLCGAPTAQAQSPQAPAAPPLGAEIDLDLRTRIDSSTKTDSRLYSGALRLDREIAPGVRVRLYGVRRFGAFSAQQALVEKDWGGTAGRAQAGVVRIPFGIYDPRETYASGLIDYPLARGDYAYHSVDWGAPGVAWTGGPARLQIEAAAFGGLGSGIWDQQGLVRGGAVRAQTYLGSAVFGVSHWQGGLQDKLVSRATRSARMTGADLRYTQGPILVRGEYMAGTLSGDSVRGWYLDGYYRLPRQQRWSLVGRVERFKPDDYAEARQITLGVRCVVSPDWTLAVNWRHNNGPFYAPTWTPSAPRRGDVYLQAYHHLKW